MFIVTCVGVPVIGSYTIVLHSSFIEIIRLEAIWGHNKTLCLLKALDSQYYLWSELVCPLHDSIWLEALGLIAACDHEAIILIPNEKANFRKNVLSYRKHQILWRNFRQLVLHTRSINNEESEIFNTTRGVFKRKYIFTKASRRIPGYKRAQKILRSKGINKPLKGRAERSYVSCCSVSSQKMSNMSSRQSGDPAGKLRLYLVGRHD